MITCRDGGATASRNMGTNGLALGFGRVLSQVGFTCVPKGAGLACAMATIGVTSVGKNATGCAFDTSGKT